MHFTVPPASHIQPQRWGRFAHLKCQSTLNGLHGAMPQKTIWLFAAVSDLFDEIE
jgi:hypothetical protein